MRKEKKNVLGGIGLRKELDIIKIYKHAHIHTHTLREREPC